MYKLRFVILACFKFRHNVEPLLNRYLFLFLHVCVCSSVSHRHYLCASVIVKSLKSDKLSVISDTYWEERVRECDECDWEKSCTLKKCCVVCLFVYLFDVVGFCNTELTINTVETLAVRARNLEIKLNQHRCSQKKCISYCMQPHSHIRNKYVFMKEFHE